MSQYVEFVTYEAEGTEEEQLMGLRRQAIFDTKKAHPDLLSVPLDIWSYPSKETADAANAGAADIP